MDDVTNMILRGIYHEREADDKHPGYDREMRYYNLIASGKVDEVIEHSGRDDIPAFDDKIRGVLSPNPLRNAMYHFVTGFTSKLAGTERGVTEPQPTFSTLFGEPFMPLPAEKYAEMLGERLEKYKTKVYLVNTGWTGGPYGVGSRMKLKYPRAMVTAALNGSIEKSEFIHDDIFNVDIPKEIQDCPSDILNPRDTWKDKSAYDEQAKKLANMFKENFEKKYPHMPEDIKNAGPKTM